MAAGLPTLVLGVGNVLMGDEGVGVHVAESLLAGPSLAPAAEVLDGGTGGFTLLEALTSHLRAIIVDASLDGRPPGTVTLRRPRRAAHFPTVLGAHDIGLRALVEAAELLGRLPRILLITVSVEDPFEMGLEMSPSVAASVPRVEALVRRMLSRSIRWRSAAPPSLRRAESVRAGAGG